MKHIFIVALLFIFSFLTVGQEQNKNTKQAIVIEDTTITQKPPFKDKLYLGGNLGLSFGSYTNVIIAPIMGIRWSRRFNSEIGIEYNYTKDSRYDTDYTYNQYGGRISSQFFFIPQLFAHAEFAGLSMEQYFLQDTQYIKERNFVPFLYLGGGLRQNIGNRSYMSFRIMFDVLNNKNSPYSPGEPFYSVGFGVGL